MKNIHVLPTDKPSRFSLKSSGEYCLTNQLYTNSPNFTNRHIYITSDEEIKEGDWCIDLDTYTLFKLGNWKTENGKKIILTTDPDLIGVQSIDNEFLEWFVKNPSCEEVEVENKKVLVGWEPDYTYEDLGIDGSKNVYHNFYKIIIPQETLEEAADRLAKKYGYDIEGGKVADFVDGVVRGAEWQAERIPSIIEEYLETAFISKEQGYMNPQKWFEQFKKK